MKKIILAVSLVASANLIAATSQDLVLNQNFTNEQVDINSPTYEYHTDYYTVWTTCYTYEQRSVQVCNYNDSSSSSSGSSSSGSYSGGSSSGGSGHVSGRGTRYRDRRDRRDGDKDFDKGCYWTTRSVAIPYSCQETRSRTTYQRDGGMQYVDFNVAVVNPEIIDSEINFSVAIDTSRSGLGKKVDFDTNIKKSSSQYLRYVKNGLGNSYENGDRLMSGELVFEVINANSIKSVIKAKSVSSDLTKESFTLTIPTKVYDKKLFTLEVALTKKQLIFYKKVETKEFKLSDLEVVEEGENTIVTVPVKDFEFFKEQITDTYKFKTRIKFADDKMAYPAGLTMKSRSKSKLRFERDFEADTIIIK